MYRRGAECLELWLNVLAPWLQFWWKSKVGRQNAQQIKKMLKHRDLHKFNKFSKTKQKNMNNVKHAQIVQKNKHQ